MRLWYESLYEEQPRKNEEIRVQCDVNQGRHGAAREGAEATFKDQADPYKTSAAVQRQLAPRPAASLGGARLASGMPALRAAFTDLFASWTAAFNAAKAASCLRGGFRWAFGVSPSDAAARGRAYSLPAGSLPLLPPAAALACSALMCACSWGAGSMLAQCGHGSSRSIPWQCLAAEVGG